MGSKFRVQGLKLIKFSWVWVQGLGFREDRKVLFPVSGCRFGGLVRAWKRQTELVFGRRKGLGIERMEILFWCLGIGNANGNYYLHPQKEVE